MIEFLGYFHIILFWVFVYKVSRAFDLLEKHLDIPNILDMRRKS